MSRKSFICSAAVVIMCMHILTGCAETEVLQNTETEAELSKEEASKEKISETEADTVQVEKKRAAAQDESAENVKAAAQDESTEKKEAEVQNETTKNKEAKVRETTVREVKLPASGEVSVDFPFEEEEPYSLALCSQGERKCELRLYSEAGEVLQRIPCGVLTESLQLSYDDLDYSKGECLEIFPADGDTGLLFRWNREDGRFSENIIEIPKYVECRDSAMLVVEEEKNCQVKKIYQINQSRECADEIRLWKLEKDTGKLQILDELEEESLFEGIIQLLEDGTPLNEEYFEMLFWENRYFLWDYREDASVRISLDEPGEKTSEISRKTKSFGQIQRELFGDAYTAEYESREAFLADFGVENDTPMYQYYDQYHNLQLELYQDKSLEQFLGIFYEYDFDTEKKKRVKLYGFTINTVREETWEEPDIFGAKLVGGEDITEYTANPEEIIEYTPSGQKDYYRCQRIAEREVDGEIKDTMCIALEINYVYRKDGTLFCRDYRHDPFAFGSTLSSLRSFYDEEERVLYEKGYITHGELEFYYIYDGKKDVQLYCLCIDHNMGYAQPYMVRYD